MNKLSKKVSLIVLAIFLSIFLGLNNEVLAAEESTLIDTASVDYKSISGLALDGIVSTASDYNNLTTVVLGYVNEGTESRYKIVFTENGTTYKEKYVDAILKEFGEVSSESESIVATSLYFIEDSYYVACDIVDSSSNIRHAIIKFKNITSYSMVNLPTISDTYYEMSIYKYYDSYIYSGYKDIKNNSDTYEYYTTSDFVRWSKHKIDLSLFRNEHDVVSLLSINSSGISFIGSAEDTIDEVLITKDFKTYTLVNEDNILEDIDSGAYENIEMIRTESKSTSLDYSMIVSYENDNKENTDENVYNGFDIWLSEIYPNGYEKLLSFKEQWKYMEWYFTWSADEETKSPIVIFVDTLDNSTAFVFEDYKDKNYIEYNTKIQAEKINKILNIGEMYFVLYDNQYIIYSEDNFKTAKRTKLSTKFDDMFFDSNSNLVLVNDSKSISVDIVDIIELSTKIKLSECEMTGFVTSKIYTKSPIKQSSIRFKHNGTTLRDKVDYSCSYKNNVELGLATMTVTGKGNYEGTITKTFRIIPRKVTGLRVSSYSTTSLKLSWYRNEGKIKGYKIYKWDPKAEEYKYYARTTSNSYTIKNLKAGSTYLFQVKAYININGNDYNGDANVRLKTTTKTSTPSVTLSAGSRKVTIRWKKPYGTTGYEIYMKSSSNGSYSRIKTITNSSTTTYTKTGLKKGRRYYFRVKTYRTVDGKKVYSSYSSTKSVVVK